MMLTRRGSGGRFMGQVGRRRVRTALVALVAVVGTTVVSTPATGASPWHGPAGVREEGPPAAPVQWSPCSAAELAGLECGRVQVPLDYDDPTGPTISVAVSRLR